MRALCVVKWLINGGAENNAINIINYLAETSNIPIDILVLNDKSDELKHKISPCVDNIFFGISDLKKIKLLILSRQYSHMFAGDHRIGVYLSMINFFFPFSKRIVICRCINNLSLLLKNKGTFEKILFQFFLRRINLLISQCNAMSDDLKINWKVSNDKVVTIYNPVTKCNDFNEPFQIKNLKSTIQFLFVGRFSQQKQLLFMVKAFHLAMKKTSLDLHLNLVGFRDWMNEDLITRNELCSYIKENNIESSISIYSYTKHADEYFLNSDFFLLTSLYEGFPNVLIEANFHGLPVISTDCDFGPKEIIENDFNGFIVPVDDIKIYSDKIIEAIDKNWNHKEIQKYTEKFSAEIQYGILLDKINKL